MTKKLLLILCANFLVTAPCLATIESIPVRNYHIRQERFSANGVLVTRPNPKDQKIVAIVSHNQIRNLADYSSWLEKNMTYQADSLTDQWLTPEEFLRIKKGDCEDYAFLNSQVLRVLGFSPHIITFHSKYSAHAICAFEYQGKFYWFDNATIKSSTARDLRSFAKEITETLHYVRSFELDPQTHKSILIYERG